MELTVLDLENVKKLTSTNRPTIWYANTWRYVGFDFIKLVVHCTSNYEMFIHFQFYYILTDDSPAVGMISANIYWNDFIWQIYDGSKIFQHQNNHRCMPNQCYNWPSLRQITLFFPMQTPSNIKVFSFWYWLSQNGVYSTCESTFKIIFSSLQ